METNRIPLFRGKDGTGEWRYGSLMVEIRKIHNVDQFMFTIREIDGKSEVVVDGKTVGQFTGLKDNRSNQIWEGDIVMPDNWTYCYMKYRVVFDRPTARFLFFQYIDNDINSENRCGDNIQSIGHHYDYVDEVFGQKIVVCGNIHNNPKLLRIHPYASATFTTTPSW